MSVKIFTWLTLRFREDYMEIQKLQNGMFVSFSLGWAASRLQTWKCQAALETLPVLYVWQATKTSAMSNVEEV